MRYFPVMLDVARALVLVVGGGPVGTRKVTQLREAGARVRVVTLEALPELHRLAEADPDVDLHLRAYQESDLDGVRLVFTAIPDRAVDREIFRAASERGLWVNAADVPELCSFLLAARLERGPLQVSVSTGGASPTLAVRVRDEIESVIGPEYGRAAEVLGALRQQLPAGERRMRAFASLLDGGLVEALRRGDDDRVRRLTEEASRAVAAAAGGGSGGGEGSG